MSHYYTQSDVARTLGISRQRFSAWVNHTKVKFPLTPTNFTSSGRPLFTESEVAYLVDWAKANQTHFGDKKKDTHGHVQCYNAGCRCDECKRANTARANKSREVREAKQLDPDDPRHGTYNFYVNWGCRCEPCTKTNTTNYKRSKFRHNSEEAKFYSKYGCPCSPCTLTRVIVRRQQYNLMLFIGK